MNLSETGRQAYEPYGRMEGDSKGLIYTLEGCNYQTIMLPQAIHSEDERLMSIIRDDLDRQRPENLGSFKLFFRVIDHYQDMVDDYGCRTDGSIWAGVNLLHIIFPMYHESGRFESKYGSTLNMLLASGHYSGLYFEALHLMCADGKENRKRGHELMCRLVDAGNPLAEKRTWLMDECGYVDDYE